MRYIILCAGILFMSIGCCDTSSDNLAIADLSVLKGKTFYLIVDRIAVAPGSMLPADDLDETNYAAFEGEKIYTVSFSGNGQNVTLEPGSMAGVKADSKPEVLSYTIDDGLFAGGRFVVWSCHDKLNAELTIYGSGIPIIGSERGDLVTE